MVGGLVLTGFLMHMPFVFFASGGSAEDEAHGWWAVLMAACYLPLTAWGPLLLAVTYAYYRRRVASTRDLLLRAS